MTLGDEYRFKNQSAEVLRELGAIIAKVEKRCAPSRCRILPMVHSLRNVGIVDGWHRMEVLFVCSVEYTAKKLEPQIRALERIAALGERIAVLREISAWRLPTGKIVWTRYRKGPDGKLEPL